MGILDTISVRKLKKLLKAYGFEEARQKGSHISYIKKGLNRPLILPIHGKEIPFYVVKELIKILHLTPKDFLKALNKYK